MSGALSYLFFTRLKNSLKELVKHPAKLVYMLFLIFFVGFSVFAGNLDSGNITIYRDVSELAAIAFALYAVMFVLLSYNGFSRGGAMFGMSDVNLIFTAPFPPYRVLFYGLLLQLRTALLLGFFILYQYSWVHSVYGIEYGMLLLILLGYALTIFCGQLTAMLLYSLTASDDGRRKLYKAVFWAVIAAFAVLLGVEIIAGGGFTLDNLLARAVECATHGVFSFFPVAGFASKMVFGALTGDLVTALLGAGLAVAYAGAIIGFIVLTKRDYYEDVIATAESAQSAIAAQRQGEAKEAVPQNVKLGKLGFDDGEGAKMFFKKHLVENRRGGVFGISVTSIIFIAITVIFSLFMPDAGVIGAFAMSVYMLIFTVALGRFAKELAKPYIYLVPEPPLKKLVWALAEALPTFLLESAVTFIPVGLILSLSPVEIVGAIIGRFGFCCLFLSVVVLIQRIFSSTSIKSLTVTFTILSMLILAVPSVIVAFITFFAFESIGVSLMITAAVNIPVAVLVLFFCRNLLQYSELNNR